MADGWLLLDPEWATSGAPDTRSMVEAAKVQLLVAAREANAAETNTEDDTQWESSESSSGMI